MANCKFVFDVVLTQFESPKLEVKDPQKLSVNTSFNSKAITITSSRINVSEFKPGTGIEFQAVPKKLRKSVEECGLPMTVSYNARVIGTGRIDFPPKLIDSIEDGMSDMVHTDTCNFEKDGEVLGTLSVLCRLIIKCDDEPNPEERLCRSNMDKSINQEDILFLMSESQRCPSPCDPCLDILEAEEGDDVLLMDLQRYKTPNAGGKRATETFIHNPVGNSACCEIKKMMQDCDDIVNSITKSAGLSLPMKPPCRGPEEANGVACIASDHLGDEYPPISPYVPCFSYLPARQEEKPDFCSKSLIPVPISDKDKSHIKPSRFCPVCLTNMSWLPKFATCPTCGVRTMPVVEERHKDQRLTADNIIAEYLGKPDLGVADYCADPCDKPAKTDEGPVCRCTCKYGKLCAHCRIRKMCEHIFQSTKKDDDCPKIKPNSSEDFCVMDHKEEEEGCRPFLARVFSELRDMYDIKDTKVVSEGQDIDEQLTHKSQKKKPVQISEKVATQKERKLHKPVDRKNPVFSPRHKNCVKQDGAVSHRHGWAWIRQEQAYKHGWQPGYIRKSVKKLMKFFLKYPPANAFNECQKLEAEKSCAQPTLNISKKNGEICITLRALNNPNINMEPIVFKIVKSDLAVAISQIKRKLKEKGFCKCTCHQPVMMCVCRDIMEKKLLEKAIEKESRRRGVQNCVDELVLTDTSDSEMEYDFNVTPPAGTAKPPSSRKRRIINHSTQTNKKDLKVPQLWPATLNPYWRPYDCAAGDRYTGTAFGNPGEAVFEDGVFGFRGGGPHGASAAPGGKQKTHGIWGGGAGGPMRGGGRAGAGHGGAGRHGGGAGHGGFGGKSFPGAVKVPGEKGKSPPIPVKMTQRYYKAVAKAEKERKDAIKAEIEKKKKGIHLIKYLEKQGAVPTPWDPNEPKPKGEVFSYGPVIGPDGLTDAQRKRQALQQMPIPPLDTMPRLGKGYDPCNEYNRIQSGECCDPCGYSYYC